MHHLRHHVRHTLRPHHLRHHRTHRPGHAPSEGPRQLHSPDNEQNSQHDTCGKHPCGSHPSTPPVDTIDTAYSHLRTSTNASMRMFRYQGELADGLTAKMRWC